MDNNAMRTGHHRDITEDHRTGPSARPDPRRLPLSPVAPAVPSAGSPPQRPLDSTPPTPAQSSSGCAMRPRTALAATTYGLAR